MMSATLSLRQKYGLAVKRVIAPADASGEEPALPYTAEEMRVLVELGRVDGLSCAGGAAEDGGVCEGEGIWQGDGYVSG